MKFWQSLEKLCGCHVCNKTTSNACVIHIQNCGGCPKSSVVEAQARSCCVKWLETILDGLHLLSLETAQKEKAVEESKTPCET